MSDVQPAPREFSRILGHLGPGLIISASIVGSGELILTPNVGASSGFDLLWFVVFGCIIKVLVQVELGRYAVARGATTLAALNTIPGPRLVVSWLVWLWLFMFIGTLFQVAGILGGVASVLAEAGLPVSQNLVAVVIGALTAVLLAIGRYRTIQTFSTVMVAAFTACTIVAVGALQTTPFAVTASDLARGFSFRLPDSFTAAFAAFGIIGVGASELIYYPYWCLEKGYARHVGHNDGSPAWQERARGWLRVMRIDAWFSCVVYTLATVAFFVLGAAVLHAKGLTVENSRMIATLAHMYRESFGAWSHGIFLCGAFFVLYSTIFVATASNTRLIADAMEVFRLTRFRDETHRAQVIRRLCVALPVAWTLMYVFSGEPVTLVLIGAFAQALILPFLAIAALWLHHRRTERALQPGTLWRAFLWLSATCMVATGVYKFVEEVQKRL